MEQSGDIEEIPGQKRRDSDYLREFFSAHGEAIGFFQALRLFEHSDRLRNGEQSAGFGTEAHLSDGPVRLKVNQGSHYPETEIARIRYPKQDEPDRPLEIYAQFLGLIGPSGALPLHYSDYAQQRLRRRDGALVDFLDGFHHRALSFFYRAWKKYRIDMAAEEVNADGSDAPGSAIAAIAGLYPRSLQGRMKIRHVSLLGYAGILARRVNETSLRTILSDAIDAPVSVRPFKGRWSKISTEEQTRIGDPWGGAYNALGETAVLGSSYWDVQRLFEICIGPVRMDVYKQLMPGGELYSRIQELSRLAVGPTLGFDLVVSLEHDRSKPIRLTAEDAPRLGWSSWLAEPNARSSITVIALPGSVESP